MTDSAKKLSCMCTDDFCDMCRDDCRWVYNNISCAFGLVSSVLRQPDCIHSKCRVLRFFTVKNFGDSACIKAHYISNSYSRMTGFNSGNFKAVIIWFKSHIITNTDLRNIKSDVMTGFNTYS